MAKRPEIGDRVATPDGPGTVDHITLSGVYWVKLDAVPSGAYYHENKNCYRRDQIIKL